VKSSTGLGTSSLWWARLVEKVSSEPRVKKKRRSYGR